MRRIIVREARPGMRVARAVADPRHADRPAVALGAELTVQQIITLHELGVYDLWVEEPDLEGLTDLVATSLGSAQQRLGEAVLKSFRKLMANGGGSGTDPQRSFVKRHRLILEELMHALVKAAPAVPSFNAMALQHPELLQHATDVCVLAALMGLQLEGYLIDQRRRLNCRQARDVLNLVMGCLMHDVGEVMMPPKQRESQVPLTTARDDAEGTDWQQHTSEGFTAVRKYIDPSAATVVLHHHQHFDGTGFAVSESRNMIQKGAGIHVYSRIAMAADVFSHVLCPAESGGPIPVVKALFQIQQDPIRSWFDPVILEALVAMMPPFVPGMVVTLSDRRQAVVTRVHADSPCYPEVQVLRSMDEEEGTKGEVLDLANGAGMRIVEVEGTDVSNYLYGLRCGRPLVAA